MTQVPSALLSGFGNRKQHYRIGMKTQGRSGLEEIDGYQHQYAAGLNSKNVDCRQARPTLIFELGSRFHSDRRPLLTKYDSVPESIIGGSTHSMKAIVNAGILFLENRLAERLPDGS